MLSGIPGNHRRGTINTTGQRSSLGLRAASTSSPSNYQQPLHTFSLFCVLCMKINIFHLLYLQRRCYYSKLKVTNVYLTSGEQMYVDLDILDIFLQNCTVISLLKIETWTWTYRVRWHVPGWDDMRCQDDLIIWCVWPILSSCHLISSFWLKHAN